MLKVGIIGFGKMGMLHGALLEGSRQAQVVAICDKSMVMRMGFKKVHPNVSVYKDVDKMLEREVLDIIVVSTPTFNHRESVIKSLKKGCHIFVEKPLAINVKQGKEIIAAAAEANRIVQIGYCNRFAESIRLGKKKIEEKRIGQIQSIVGRMYIGDVFEAHTGWRYKKEFSGGGALMDFGIHMIDLLIWMFGQVHSVEASTSLLYSKEVEDEARAKLLFDNGIECDFETSWSREEYRKSYTNLKVNGTGGHMVITDQTLDIYDLNNNKVESYTYPQLYSGCFMDIGGILYSKQMTEFLTYIEGGSTSGATAEEAVYVQQVIESIYKSANENKLIRVGEVNK